ncbi:MAG: AAA family ATPase [Chloroflexota bacterium]|nr:AAA family ATPase [Chloroflexota bacterium]
MPRADLMRELFKAHARKDDEAFRAAALKVVSEERRKNHRLLAEDLERIVMNDSRPTLSMFPRHELVLPKDRERGADLVEISISELDWDRIVLPAATLELLQDLALEHLRADILAASGLTPRNTLVFYGPPGCGKTLAARVLAGVLSRPLVTVRFDAIVSSLLGETASNLRSVFDFIARGEWVVLFDEFDAIGKERDNAFEHSELKRLVNTLLQLMDSFRGESVLIAATNHQGLLDTAIWRRFDVLVPFGLPGPQDRILMLRQFLASFDTSSLSLRSLGRRLARSSGGDIERVAQSAARRAVLDGRSYILKQDVEPAIRDFRRRLEMDKVDVDELAVPEADKRRNRDASKS